MGVFYALIFTPIIVQHFVVRTNEIDYKKKNQNALLFFFVFLTILVMVRHLLVGSDTINYSHIFENIAMMDWGQLRNYSLEIGFTYFIKIVSIFSKDYRVFFCVTAIMTSAMMYPTYKRLCVDASLTIVLFCLMSTFVMMFSGIRQMLAVGIGFIAYEFARNKKITHFILAVALAMTIHVSAFMLIFMYPLYRAKITSRWLWVVVPSLLTVFVFNKQIFSILGWLLEQYTKYDVSITQTGAYTMLILFSMFAVFSFIVPDDSKLDDETIGLRNFLLLSVALQMFAPLHTIAMRMNYYYIIFIPLLIPKIISARSEKWGHLAVLSRYIMVGFFLLYFFYNAYTSTHNLHVFPYHFFWENV